MKISIITLFPEMFDGVLNTSILGRAQKKELVEFKIINLRDYGEGNHKTVDDKSFGGGVGMVLKADVLAKSVSSIRGDGSRVILTSASGKKFDQIKAKELARREDIIIVCGHYEGVDQRFIERYVDEEISIGDFVLTGGEIPAMTIADSIVRLIPGVLEKEEAIQYESFENNLLEYPHYTRPQNFEGLEVPKVLISGNHQEIDLWRRKKAWEKTKKIRPDLIERI